MRLLSALAGLFGILALAGSATGTVRIGAPAGCALDPHCAPALARAYGVDVRPALVTLAPGAPTYRALRAGEVDVAVARTTDPEARDGDLRRLLDDRAAAPVDVVAPVVRRAALLDRPALADALAPLGRRLSPRDLVALGLALRQGRTPGGAAAVVLARLRLFPAPTVGPPVRVLADAGPEGRALALVAVGALRAAGLAARVQAVARTPGLALRAIQRGEADVWPTPALALLDRLTGSRGTRGAGLATSLDLLRGVLAAHRAAVLDARSARTRLVLLTTRSTAAALGLARLADLARPELGLPLVEPVPAPATTDRGPLPPLAPGALGRSVAALQAALLAIGYDPGPASGAYGERTRRAVLALQEGAGLPADGVADDATLAAIDRRRHGPAAPTTPGTVRGDPAGRTVYLTFDDGPVPGSTERVLALLARWDALATFFPIGQQIAMYPDLARAAAAAGHAIGAHTWHHENLAATDPAGFAAAVGAGLRTLRRVTHRTTTCLRPPFGAVAGSTAPRAAELGLRLVLWDVDPQDWRLPGAGAIAARVLAGVRPGSIVLLHDGGGPRGGTIEALGTILRVLTARGYRFAALPCG